MLFLLSLFYFISSILCRGSESYQYVWIPKHNMELKSSWLNENLPCENDMIAFQESKLASTFISGGLKSNEILLPDNGVIFIDNYAIIGDKADWQCPKREQASEAFFEPKNILPNVFDPKNWKIVGENNARPRLHCDLIPSQLDEATFPIDSSFRAEVDAPLIVGKLNYSNQFIRHSDFILTMEGQMIFSIGPKLTTTLVIDHIDYQMPNTEIIRIVDGPIAGPKGILSSNAFEPQMSEICRFIECPDWKSYCTNPIKPIGHCCQTCGASATFYHPSLNLNNVKKLSERVANSILPITVGLDMSRIDKTAVIPKYQISVITENLEEFDEDSFYDAADTFYNEFVFMTQIEDETDGNGLASMFTGYEIFYSLETGKIRLRPILETLLFIGLLAGVIAIYLRYLYKTSPRFRLWISSQTISNRMVVAWQNAKEFTEEKVEVIFRQPEPVVHAFAHYRNEPYPFEAASSSASSSNQQQPNNPTYFAEFRNPTFVEYSPEELETKPDLKEIKEEKLFDLDL